MNSNQQKLRSNNSQWLILFNLLFSLVACFAPAQPQQTASPSSPLPATAVTKVTPSPTLIPSNPIIPTQSVTIGGYIFHPPVEVPDGRGSVKIVGWLPDNPNEIIDARYGQVVSIDVYTGQIESFSQLYQRRMSLSAIRLLKNNQVAFIPDPSEGVAPDLWISGAGEEQAKAPIATNIALFPIMLADKETMLLTDADFKQSWFVKADGTTAKASNFRPELLASMTISVYPNHTPLPIYSASSPTGKWIAAYNTEQFYIIDLNSERMKKIDLKPQRYVHHLAWSPNGDKIAILATREAPLIEFLELFIVKVDTWQVEEIETGFQYVQDISWSPNNVNLLLAIETGKVETAKPVYYKSSLFLLNSVTKDLHLIDILPNNTILATKWGLAWALDGKKIALSAVYPPPGNPQLYRIDVDKEQ